MLKTKKLKLIEQELHFKLRKEKLKEKSKGVSIRIFSFMYF